MAEVQKSTIWGTIVEEGVSTGNSAADRPQTPERVEIDRPQNKKDSALIEHYRAREESLITWQRSPAF